MASTTVKNILFRDKMNVTRLGLSLGSFLWSFQLALPAQLFPTAEQLANGTGRQTYSLMARVMPEELWSLCFLVHGLSAMYSLRTGARTKFTLLFDAILGSLLWTGSTFMCFAAYWPSKLPLLEAIQAYPPPAAMSGEAILAWLAWWYMIKHWAREPTAPRDRSNKVVTTDLD